MRRHGDTMVELRDGANRGIQRVAGGDSRGHIWMTAFGPVKMLESDGKYRGTQNESEP